MITISVGLQILDTTSHLFQGWDVVSPPLGGVKVLI